MAGALAQIARQLGVSVSTVSRALSGRPGVAAGTRARVQALADRLGAVPAVHARMLRTGRGSGLAILAPFRPTTVAALRLQALFAAAQESFGSVRVLVDDGLGLGRLVSQALQLSPEAMVVTGGLGPLPEEACDALRRRSVAVVGMDVELAGYDSVRVSRLTGAYQAARLLLLGGARHPLFFTASDPGAPDERLRAILAAFDSLGREPAPACFARLSGSGFEAGYALARSAWSRQPVDALFAYNDEMAVGAMRALQEAGARTPEDVRVVGFDDLPMAAFLACPLTTVTQPVAAVAQAAIDLCLARLRSPQSPAARMDFLTTLIVRASAPRLAPALMEAVFAGPAGAPTEAAMRPSVVPNQGVAGDRPAPRKGP